LQILDGMICPDFQNFIKIVGIETLNINEERKGKRGKEFRLFCVTNLNIIRIKDDQERTHAREMKPKISSTEQAKLKTVMTISIEIFVIKENT